MDRQGQRGHEGTLCPSRPRMDRGSNLVLCDTQPDSQKSFTEQVGDTFKGNYDSFASSAQPEVSRFMQCQASDAITKLTIVEREVVGSEGSRYIQQQLEREPG